MQGLGSAPVTSIVRRGTAKRLRVLAYHDVTDPRAFERHLDHLQHRYTLVSGLAVAAAVLKRIPLADEAVWLTFDDAHPGVIEHALPLLQQRGLPATLFVCPGVVDSSMPYWWQVLEVAIERGVPFPESGGAAANRAAITRLKQADDAERRAIVAATSARLTALGANLRIRQITTAEIQRWLAAGLEVGNHTWDHPCLHTCDEGEQRRQISAAHAWFRDVLDVTPTTFAYPNGDRAEAAADELASLGYAVTALFDHRMSAVTSSDVSRLRIDADAPPDRFRAIASGAHSEAFRLVAALHRTSTARSAVHR